MAAKNARESHIVLPDRRMLAYAEYGPSDGHPVLYCHGFPSSRLEAQLWQPAADALGIRVIAPDRPGYGSSDPCPGRTLADFAADAVVLLDRLGIGQVGVLGISGGGPYALALLALAPERVAGAALVCALGPPEALAAVHDRLAPFLRRAWRVAQHGPALIPFWAGVGAQALRLRSRVAFNAQFVAGADLMVLADPDIQGLLRRSQREGLRRGAVGAARDLVLYLRPWRFRLSSISTVITIWHGQADRLVPVDMAYELASRLTHGDLRVLAGEGHYSLPVRCQNEIMKSVLRDT